ncbi:hypothetical protein P3U41_05970 [Mammaliicoccus sciuri]|uniref:hypothetical protein n=1 Tax=Mammaliicoccus sciuri TaxID=1296 RepID=UPI002B2569AC|nr:hypothetical protein [Mammaliicoccus sciuri]WQL34317.1 hypothetical protein P3U41_05970 [Mammaliicoccus sciuri]WQL61256.1 hypothetical protein P3T96_05970 [Mammaliicoccus sciuri]
MFEEKVGIMRIEDGDYVTGAQNAVESKLKPKMITNVDDSFIIVEDSLENNEKFQTLLEWAKDILYEEFNPYIKCQVIYSSPEEFNKIWEETLLKARIWAKNKKQELIDNAPIDEDINKIGNVKELIDYLIEDREYNVSLINGQFSTNISLDEIILEVEQKKLKRLADLYLEDE